MQRFIFRVFLISVCESDGDTFKGKAGKVADSRIYGDNFFESLGTPDNANVKKKIEMNQMVVVGGPLQD